MLLRTARCFASWSWRRLRTLTCTRGSQCTRQNLLRVSAASANEGVLKHPSASPASRTAPSHKRTRGWQRVAWERQGWAAEHGTDSAVREEARAWPTSGVCRTCATGAERAIRALRLLSQRVAPWSSSGVPPGELDPRSCGTWLAQHLGAAACGSPNDGCRQHSSASHLRERTSVCPGSACVLQNLPEGGPSAGE